MNHNPSRRAVIAGIAAGATLLISPIALGAIEPDASPSEPLTALSGRALRVPVDAAQLSVTVDGVALRPGRDFVVEADGRLALTSPRAGARRAEVRYTDRQGSIKTSMWRLG